MEYKIISPKNNEYTIKTDVSIISDLDKLRLEVAEQAEKYKGLVYTDLTIKEAKNDRAKLNKFKETIESARKVVKNAYQEPLKEFEETIKSILKPVDEVTLAIDNQVKAYETRKKDEKQARLLDVTKNNLGGLVGLVDPLRLISNTMLNSSYNEKNAIKEIEEKIAKIKGDLETIKNLKSDNELILIDTYLATFDIGAALNRARQLDEIKEKAKVAAVIVEPVEVKPIEQVGEVSESTKLYTRKFEVTGTKEDLIWLGEAMKSRNIKYKGI